ncbi:something about silencing protein 10 isoform X2 [Latimeria chalumnae]|uniref:UTP3 small subunit processome component n=1 Tax=Latimeria chalumnae TaxID=7897 RepID=H3ANW6_LATCH|nr:PREDICTED: something about silencing protein 10 [Latimeria chalumnae]|eukprot:XP_014341980.1 PREDICTED: something about silencing protein 10 [Latimeria chalumnae]
MAKTRRTPAHKKQKPKKVEEYGSDDPESYKDMSVPDQKSAEYLYDDVDDFHEQKFKKLMAAGVELNSDNEDLEDEEEVLALDVSDSEDQSDMESDLEGTKDEDLPNELAWGQKKKMYYDTDYMSDNYTKSKNKEEEDAEAEEEEQEAQNIQKRLVGNLSEEDYGLDFIQAFAEQQGAGKEMEKEEKIAKDLKKMSLKEKLKLLKKESPEFLELIEDFKMKLAELKDELQPLMEMQQEGEIPPGKGADYLHMKYQLYLNYCTNISFYLVLKAKRIPVHNHPVIERLVTYRNLINDLAAVDSRLSPEIQQLLVRVKTGKRNVGDTEKLLRSKKSAISQSVVAAETHSKTTKTEILNLEVPEDSDSEMDEEAALQYYREMEEKIKLKRKRGKKEEELEEEPVEETDPDAKRGITYQIAKNKGLTPKRNKINRNPRVKHREKFRRALVRRKGQVREVRKEEHRYGGELSGIRAGVKKSTKLQ